MTSSPTVVSVITRIGHNVSLNTYHWFSLRNASKEDEVSHEKADTEVQVDGGASPLYGAAEFERQDGQYQTEQRDDQPYLGQQLESKSVLEDKG